VRMAYRSLMKMKAFSFINIFGLGIGMAAFLFIIHYVRYEWSYEGYNKNVKDIYRVTLDNYNGSEYVMTDCETHPPLGPLLKETMPEVRDFVRMFHIDNLKEITANSKKFLEDDIYLADQSIFEIFSVNVLKGDKLLSEPFQAALTLSTANKYFGDADPVGQTIEINKHVYHITSVIENVPSNTHLKFNILLSHSSLVKISAWYKEDDWRANNEFTYLLMTSGTDILSFNKKLTNLSIELKDKINYSRYAAEPMKDIHLYSNKSFEPEANGSARIVYFLLIIAAFIIVIAWVNYINLSTARAMERAREVGIRKVMGSLKRQLIFQFLSESVIVNVLGGLIALMLFYATLPIFRDLTGQSFSLVFINDTVFWYLLLSLIFIGSILSGIYPALVLSSFQPAAVLKGKFQSSVHGQRLRKGLVIFQFSATVVLIVCLSAVYMQINFLRNYDLGVNIDQTLIIRAPHVDLADSLYKESLKGLKTELLRNSEIEKIASADAVPGVSVHELSTTGMRRYGEEKGKGNYEYYFFAVDEDFIQTLSMTLLAGRNFQGGVPNHDEVIISEEAAKLLGFPNAEAAVGEKITFRTRMEQQYSTVIGVLKNYHQRSPKEKPVPMLFCYGSRLDYLAVRLKSDDMKKSIQLVKATWDQIFPNAMFNYFFLDEVYNNQYQSDVRFGRVIATFSGLAVFIACLGLFGLSSYTIVQRSKEIGIRKVLGASVNQIVQLLSIDFVKVIMIASLLAMPLAYFVISEWLSTYSVRINLNILMFIVPVIIILLMALITVSFQTIRTAIANPVDSLKQE
jgi:putative ABC transport system permease protein